MEPLNMPQRARLALGSLAWDRVQRLIALIGLFTLAGAFGSVTTLFFIFLVAHSIYETTLLPEVFTLGLSLALLGTSLLNLLFWYPLVAARFARRSNYAATMARDAIAQAEDVSSGGLVGLFIGLEILLTGGTFISLILCLFISSLNDVLFFWISGVVVALGLCCGFTNYFFSLFASRYPVGAGGFPLITNRRQIALRQEVMNLASKTHLMLLMLLMALCLSMAGFASQGGFPGHALSACMALLAGCAAIALVASAIITTREPPLQEATLPEQAL